MRKNEFLNEIRGALRGYPRNEVENSIEFYSEMIEDRVENGMSEEQAVASLGNIDMIIKDIKLDMPLKSVIRETAKERKEERIRENKHMGAGTIILLIRGAPLWIPLLIVAMSLFLVFFILLWVFDIVLFVVGIALAASLAGGIIGGVMSFIAGNPGTGIAWIGAGIVALGLAIFLFIAGVGMAKANLGILGSMARGTKRRMLGA